MSETPQEPRPKSNRELAKSYWIHGIVVGPLVFLMGIIGIQAAAVDTEAIFVASVVTSLLQPVPMFIVALALSRGWRWGRLLAISLPIVVVALCALAYCFVVPGRPQDLSLILPLYFRDSQMFNFPGALILAILTARSPRDDPR